MYVFRNIHGRSRNNWCIGKAINITHFCVCACARVGEGMSVCVCVCECVRGCLSECTGSEAGAGVCLRASSLTYPVSYAHVPYYLRPLASPRFSTVSHKWHDFGKNLTEHKMCVLIFSTNVIWNIYRPKKKAARYIVINVNTSSCKVPVILIGF